MIEPRAAGKRYFDPTIEAPAETPRFTLDGTDLTRYIPDPTPENSAAATEASKKVSVLPHIIHKARITVIAALKAEGYSRKQIAEAMGMEVSGVAWCIRKARESGALQRGMEEAVREMDEEAVPLAIENILAALQNGDVDVAVKVASGRGLLRNYATNKNDGPSGGGPSTAFQFNFVLANGEPAPNADELQGKILGVRKT